MPLAAADLAVTHLMRYAYPWGQFHFRCIWDMGQILAEQEEEAGA